MKQTVDSNRYISGVVTIEFIISFLIRTLTHITAKEESFSLIWDELQTFRNQDQTLDFSDLLKDPVVSFQQQYSISNIWNSYSSFVSDDIIE